MSTRFPPYPRRTRNDTMVAGVIVSEEGGRLVLRDGNGQVHPITEATAYATLKSILHDPSLPRMQEVNPQHATLEEATKDAVDKLVPEALRPLVNFGLKNTSKRFRGSNRRIRKGRRP